MQTLTEYFIHHKVPVHLIDVIDRIAQTAQDIAEILKRGALNNILGNAHQINVQGEEQKKLDILSNERFIHAFLDCPFVRAIASEELALPMLNACGDNAPFLLLFDPLDGSSNIDINAPVGTIFSILPAPDVDYNNPDALNEAFLQAGEKQIAAGYILYGPATQMALTLGKGTEIFLLDTLEKNTFIHIHEQVLIPADTQEFAINCSHSRFWFAPIAQYIQELLAGKNGVRGKDFNMRWVAAMVADIHRVLHRGGVFLYPIDSKNKNNGGRLRLLYEANPMSFLITQANGAASTGSMPILKVQPKKLHERISVILGAQNEVAYIEKLHQQIN